MTYLSVLVASVFFRAPSVSAAINVLTGMLGVIYGHSLGYITTDSVYRDDTNLSLIVYSLLGGMGTLFGPVIGAIVYLVLEEFLSQVTEYWALIMGPLLLLIVLFGRGGIDGLLRRLSRG